MNQYRAFQVVGVALRTGDILAPVREITSKYVNSDAMLTYLATLGLKKSV